MELFKLDLESLFYLITQVDCFGFGLIVFVITRFKCIIVGLLLSYYKTLIIFQLVYA